jgi:head-tail adaptor
MTPRGQFDRKVEFQIADVTRSALGVEQEPTWSLIEFAWAKILYGRGEERRGASAEGSVVTATFRVLTSSKLRTVTEQHRILYGTEAWNITGVAPIGRGEIEFTAQLARQ